MTDGEAAPEVLRQALNAPSADTPALIIAETGETQTYGELAAAVERVAESCTRLGVRAGDRVAVVMPNGPEFVQVLLGVTALGAAFAPLNPAYTEDEFAFYLEDLQPRLLLLAGDGEAAARNAKPESVVAGQVASGSVQVATIDVGGSRIETSQAARHASPDDVALLLHTSGTTSRPKQVPLFHRNLMASARSIVDHYRLGGEDISFCVMPLFHVHGLVASTLASLVAGSAVLIPRRLTPSGFWEGLARFGVTWYSAGPTLHAMFLDRDRSPSRAPLKLRFVRSCSSALSVALLNRAEQRFGVPMVEAYGMTEASHEMAANPLPPGSRKPGSVGVPTGTEIRILDPAWESLPENTAGEVAVRGPGVTPGYVNNTQANAESFRDGWFRTGDQGVFEDGYLRLVGRLKELIIRGGENISPAEVEDVLKAHPAVVDAAVFGIPDDKYGELVAAAVSLSQQADHHSLTEHCRSSLTKVKVPAVIHILDEIPRTATGKLQRRRIAAAIYGE